MENTDLPGSMEDNAAPRRPLNLELARLFIRVAELGSIAGAARSLNLDASLATRKVAQLEEAFGIRLIDRTTRRLKLTAAGEIALEWARSWLDAYERTHDDLAALQHKPSGLIRMAVPPFVATTNLPRVLEKFRLDYPEIRISLTTTDSISIQAGFRTPAWWGGNCGGTTAFSARPPST